MMTSGPFGKGLEVGDAVSGSVLIVVNGAAGMHGNPRRVNR